MNFVSVFRAFGALMALREVVKRFSAPSAPSPERAQFDEERRRAEASLRMELRRQAADREIARLRLIAGASIVGWIASVTMCAAGFAGGSMPARVALAAGWVLLLGALGAAFTAQGRVGASLSDDERPLDTPAAAGALSLLISGLAVTAVSLLL